MWSDFTLGSISNMYITWLNANTKTHSLVYWMWIANYDNDNDNNSTKTVHRDSHNIKYISICMCMCTKVAGDFFSTHRKNACHAVFCHSLSLSIYAIQTLICFVSIQPFLPSLVVFNFTFIWMLHGWCCCCSHGMHCNFQKGHFQRQ